MDYNLNNRFNYHAPDDAKKEKHADVRTILLNAARAMEILVPDGRELSLVITKLEEAMFWANAGIARNDSKEE